MRSININIMEKGEIPKSNKIITFPISAEIGGINKAPSTSTSSTTQESIEIPDHQLGILSIRTETKNFTIRIMEGNIMLGYNPSFESFEDAKKAAIINLLPEDKVETTIAVIDSVNKKIHIIIGEHINLLKDPLFESNFGDFEIV